MLHDHNNAKFGWRSSGNTGPPVIFLHGMPGSREAWNPQLESLAASWHCIAWDMPGYGASALNEHPVDFQQLVSTLEEFIFDAASTHSAHLVGLSLGGMLALHAALHRPDMVRSLVILDASPKFGFGGHSNPDEFLTGMKSMIDNSDSMTALADTLLPGIMHPESPESIMATAKSAMSRATPEGIKFAAELIAIHDVADKLPEIAIPLLAMAGAEDAETPPAYARFIADSVQRGSFAEVPQSGHLCNLENHQFVSQKIDKFLRSHT